MKISRIYADNFLRLNLLEVDLDPSASIHLFCGHNEAGKSSIQEAVRFALLGETVRVSKKGDYKLMIRDGAKKGTVGVTIDDLEFVRDVKTAELAEGSAHNNQLPPDMPYLLDAQRFASTKMDVRRSHLIKLSKTAVSADDVIRRMKAKGVDEECLTAIKPMIRSGFGAAHGEAQARASGARSEWVGITGAQRYGARIADNWKAEPPETYDPEELTNKEAQIAALQGRRDDLQQEKGALSSELFAAENRKELTCPGCEAKLQVKSRRDDSGALIEELVAADSCDVDTDDLAKRIGVIAAEISGTSTSIATLTADAHELRAAGVLAEQADAITDNAAAKHKLVGKWEACAATLSPDGIPAEILSDSLKPFNNRLRSTSVATDGWPQVTVTAQMDVLVDGRPYALQSESSKWRADVALADAVAHLSGVRLLVIDRMDVLDLAGRSQFIGWMQAVQNDYDSVLIFGTLKTAPSLPAGMQSYWIEKGELES